MRSCSQFLRVFFKIIPSWKAIKNTLPTIYVTPSNSKHLISNIQLKVNRKLLWFIFWRFHAQFRPYFTSNRQQLTMSFEQVIPHLPTLKRSRCKWRRNSACWIRVPTLTLRTTIDSKHWNSASENRAEKTELVRGNILPDLILQIPPTE